MEITEKTNVLIEMLHSTDVEIRLDAVSDLIKRTSLCGIPSVMETLVEALDIPNPTGIRQKPESVMLKNSIRLLFEKIGLVAVPALIRGLNHESKWVRYNAAESLIAIGLPAIPALEYSNSKLAKLIISKINSPEWKDFGADYSHTGNYALLETVSHVTHIDSSFTILEQNMIKAGLVYDESKLNKERISVCWVSPNYWSQGFFYGNVRFTFDWKKLIADKKYYWIEAIERYSPPACRILITIQDYSSKFPEYNPKGGDGPWWYDSENDKHYWTNKYTVEFMIESNLDIKEVTKIDFVKHHPNMCSFNLDKCPDSELDDKGASGLFLAKLIAKKNSDSMIQTVKNQVMLPSNRIDSDKFTSPLGIAWEQLLRGLHRFGIDNYSGNITFENEKSLPLARAILNLYAQSNWEEFLILSSLFKSEEDLMESCIKLIETTFSLDENLSDILPVKLNRTF